ncbi:MAG: hypothetical protein V1927_00975 [Candidatus Omnitrophota bacterium]
MNRIDQVVEIAASSNHLPVVLLFLMGLFVTRKKSQSLYEDYSDVPGDNVPATLIDGIGIRAIWKN